MTVKELIEKLQQFDDQLMVVIDGYEGGVDEPKDPVEVIIKMNHHKEWYYGKHEIHHENDNDPPDRIAVYISR